MHASMWLLCCFNPSSGRRYTRRGHSGWPHPQSRSITREASASNEGGISIWFPFLAKLATSCGWMSECSGRTPAEDSSQERWSSLTTSDTSVCNRLCTSIIAWLPVHSLRSVLCRCVVLTRCVVLACVVSRQPLVPWRDDSTHSLHRQGRR